VRQPSFTDPACDDSVCTDGISPARARCRSQGSRVSPGVRSSDTGAAFSERFEDGADDWETDAHIGPEVDISEFEWEIETTGEQAASGDRSLAIYNEGDYDDGTCWAVHPVSVESGRAYDVTVSASFWSESESFNILRNAVMRIGPERPEVEEDFPAPGLSTTDLGETPYGGLREPLHLAEGWREYSFERTTPELSTDTVSLALGTSVVWETGMTHYVDDVSVTVEPR